MLGAAGGIGSALCAELEATGAAVVRADAPHAGDRADLVADLSRPGAPRELVERAWHEHGPLDILAHVAGLYPARRAVDSDEEFVDSVFAVNTRSALLAAAALAQLCVPAGRGASVVFTSSGAARRARPCTTVYAASKAALEAITRGLALELAPSGIRVNAVAPGFVDVGSALNPVPREYVEAMAGDVPFGRVATAADIVPSLLWLCHESSSWVTGHVLAADGGAGAGSPAAPSWLSR